jgi:hypothetical protein
MDDIARVCQSVYEEAGRRGYHYHVVETAVGDPNGYRDDLFRSRRRALVEAKSRAHWRAALAGCRVEALLGPPGRYLVTTGRPNDAGRLIAVEDCDDPDCLEVTCKSRLEP